LFSYKICLTIQPLTSVFKHIIYIDWNNLSIRWGECVYTVALAAKTWYLVWKQCKESQANYERSLFYALFILRPLFLLLREWLPILLFIYMTPHTLYTHWAPLDFLEVFTNPTDHSLNMYMLGNLSKMRMLFGYSSLLITFKHYLTKKCTNLILSKMQQFLLAICEGINLNSERKTPSKFSLYIYFELNKSLN